MIEKRKSNKWKWLAIIIPALGSIYAATISSIVSATSTKRSTVGSIAKQNKQMLEKYNLVIVPELTEIVHGQTEKIVMLRLQVARLEERLNAVLRSRQRRFAGSRPRAGSGLDVTGSGSKGSAEEKAEIKKLVDKEIQKQVIPKMNVQALSPEMIEELGIED